LPTGHLRGEFFVPEALIAATPLALRSYREPARDHEGILFWGGLETECGAFLMCAVTPKAEHSRGRVFVTEENVLKAVHRLRSLGLGLMAQVHSHPGEDARHSDGDDAMVVAPCRGMLSIVVPHYGHVGMMPLSIVGIHQFQDGRWVLCTDGLDQLHVVPTVMDLR
jgi:proteasome lid subunit RPN8/RPN11